MQADISIWPAPAKLNLFLHITGQRADGYHLLQSVIQFIDLADELQFSPRQDAQITVVNSNSEISANEDLSVRAAKLLQQTYGVSQGVDIQLTKKIPIGAGLGGGSSDAATTLLALNKLWSCNVSQTELESLAAQLGADVPIFVRRTACAVQGIGEQLVSIALEEPWYVVLFPKVYLNTEKMFKHPNLTRNSEPIKICDFFELEASQTSNWQLATQNVFEPLARQEPGVERAFQWLGQYLPARLTGSGSSLFAACTSKQHASEIAKECPPEFDIYVTKGMNQSPLVSLNEYN